MSFRIWRKALQETGLAPNLIEEVMQRMSDGFVPWQENSFPGLLGNVVVDAELVADQASLCSLAARLVTSMRPRYVAFGRQALENELTALFGR